MEHKYQFERLEVWQLSISFTKAIYQLTDSFPDSEKFGLVNQIRRAGVSSFRVGIYNSRRKQ